MTNISLFVAQVFTLNASKGIILSAGAIGSPQLCKYTSKIHRLYIDNISPRFSPIVMLSGIGDSMHLSKVGIKTIVDLCDVGRNLQVTFIVNLRKNTMLITPSSFKGPHASYCLLYS